MIVSCIDDSQRYHRWTDAFDDNKILINIIRLVLLSNKYRAYCYQAFLQCACYNQVGLH